MSQGVLYGVGVGPGDPELMTLKAARIIGECPVTAAPQTGEGRMLALEIARQAVDLSQKKILPLPFSMSRNPRELKRSHRQAADRILEHLRSSRSVAMLNIGDVSLYATFTSMRALVEAQGFRTVTVPGVPSFCAVAAALGETLTPEQDTPVHILPAGFAGLEEALAYPGAKVIMKAGKPLGQVKEMLRAAGLLEKARLVQDCGLPDQQIVTDLDQMEEEAGYFSTIVVRP